MADKEFPRTASALRRAMILKRKTEAEDAIRLLNVARQADWKPIAWAIQRVSRSFPIKYQWIGQHQGQTEAHLTVHLPEDGFKNRKVMRLLEDLQDRIGAPEMQDTASSYFGERRFYFGGYYDPLRVVLSFEIETTGACRRVQTGTKMVEQPIWENVCE